VNSESNVLRWGIPGWSVLLSFAIFVALDSLSGGRGLLPQAISSLASESEAWQVAFTALLVTAAGIPLGYLIYQMYFYIRWNSPVSCEGFLPPLVVGRKKDLLDTLKDITLDDINLSEGWRHGLLPSLDDHRTAWHYLARIVMDSLLCPGIHASVYPRHEYLMSMMHSLGASFLGICLGFGGYLVFKWREHEVTFASMLFPALITLAVVALLHVESRHPIHEGIPILGAHLHDAAELLLGVVLFLFICLDPVIDTLLGFPWPQVLAVVCGLLWVNFARGSKRFLLATLILTLALGLLLRAFVPPQLLQSIAWPLVFTTISFLVLTIAFLENRQNVRDQMVTMEYYYLKQYVEKHKSDKKAAQQLAEADSAGGRRRRRQAPAKPA